MKPAGKVSSGNDDETDGREAAMQDLVNGLGLGESVDLHDIEGFWRQVALAGGVPAPASTPLEMLKQTLAEIDVEWDDDFAEEDGSGPSVLAYEEVYANLSRFPAKESAAAGTVAGADGDDEGADDSILDLPMDVQVKFSFSQPDIETVVHKVREERYVLNPDWQRHYVWKSKKQRRFIESILLGLPIPSLLLFKDTKTDGRIYVIDGKQRLETIARFCAPKGGDPNGRKRFKTFPKTTEGWGIGDPLADCAGKYYQDLPPLWKSKIDNTSFSVYVFEELPPDKLYQIFSRYNTGAVQLRAAEIRNAVFQTSPLHKMMWNLAGEHLDSSKHKDEEERRTASDLRATMGGKAARYGAYDFVGRYFAFAYRPPGGSVAKATYEFMRDRSDASVNEIEALRKEFIRVFQKTCAWYDPYELCKPRPEGEFHAFLAAVQLVSTRKMLYDFIDRQTKSEDQVRAHVTKYWPGFAEEVLKLKQNSTNFWGRQADWIESLETGLPPKISRSTAEVPITVVEPAAVQDQPAP
jgi:hypothetical protein